MTWCIRSGKPDQLAWPVEESLFFTGNGYLGVRGCFEEPLRAGDGYEPIRGTYINAFHEITDVEYGEKLYGFPETQQKLANIADAQTVLLTFETGAGEKPETFALDAGEVLGYERLLHMDRGVAERFVHWRSPDGKEVKLTFRRLVSFRRKELFMQEIRIEPVNFRGRVTVKAVLNGDVRNYVNRRDPRVGARHAKLLEVMMSLAEGDGVAGLELRAPRSGLRTACAFALRANREAEWSVAREGKAVTVTATLELAGTTVLTKMNVYTDTLRHGENPLEAAVGLCRAWRGLSFEEAAAEQKEELDRFWQTADVRIEGDDALQEGIRFNLFHLLQSAGRDRHSNIAAKGLSGEGYEGHYFWDTEIYMLPVFLMTHPERARDLLLYRHSILDGARRRAKEMGHRQGALFPWRTIAGSECSAYFPAGTAQYHISADIAYGYVQYYLATEDWAFMEQYGAELLMETARLWIDVGHWKDGRFRIDAVTGPDEYTAIVNNNYYTNVMAKHNLKWAARVVDMMRERSPEALASLTERIGLEDGEPAEWMRAAEGMYLPYDPALNINPQDDSFLQKAVWDFAGTPEAHYPLLLHYHPLTLYRYQVCKQADTVLAHFLLEDEQPLDVIRDSYAYYENITTHDSSLSGCVFSIMAAKLGDVDKAYDYFIETARLDLDNTHGNTKDGLHLANMGGTWMAIVFGFAGLRLKEDGLHFAPVIPQPWNAYAFKVRYRGRLIAVRVDKEGATFGLAEGDALAIKVFGQQVALHAGDRHVWVPGKAKAR
jgi:alpha,alpha-trehalose phosphorylase